MGFAAAEPTPHRQIGFLVHNSRKMLMDQPGERPDELFGSFGLALRGSGGKFKPGDSRRNPRHGSESIFCHRAFHRIVWTFSETPCPGQCLSAIRRAHERRRTLPVH
ncbi:hypothetical protein CIHG_09559 [Coccidioides immitis H538.4]|uniref:Uncharacterized protein n=1 Tax=Coccidioides immitis H538.4 TaxID=396776 RepID=A0A0J8S638_COCIT|nr:hypothetical protein CIHG_09559 [Coccidioides immitis H538.4]